MTASLIGKRIPQLDARKKVTGEAIYGPDIMLPGMLFGKITAGTAGVLLAVTGGYLWRLKRKAESAENRAALSNETA